MHLITCPHCGLRDEAEFRYRGDASVVRPGTDGSADQFHDYLHARRNPRGWHVEWWHHSGGCRQFIKVVRNTLTHEIAATGLAAQEVHPPGAGGGRP